MFKHIFSIMLIGLALSVPVHAKSSYGPVRGQDTLWGIASKLKPKGNVTVQQTMLALYHKNPHAFDGNINKLFKGAYLKAPTYAEVRRYNQKSAVNESGRHNKHWSRGTKLPKTTPPKVPDIKDPAKAQPSKKVADRKHAVKKQTPVVAKAKVETKTKEAPVVAKVKAETKAKELPVVVAPPVVSPAAVSVSAAAVNSGLALEKEIVTLREQLKAEQEKNQRLTNELTTLQAKQAKSGSTPSIEEQVKQLKVDLKELETVLDQKDNHIKTLQASLKSASEAIKSQHEDNMRLANKLREVSPASLPSEPAASGKPGLTLAGVQEQNNEAAATAASAVGTTEKAPADTKAASSESAESAELAQVWADGGKPGVGATGNPVLNSSASNPANDVKSGGVRLTDMVGFKASQPATSASMEEASRRSISPLALAIALISLLFIVALLWRALVQQRELRRIEAEEERMAERMRKRLEENSASVAVSKREPLANLSTPTEVNF